MKKRYRLTALFLTVILCVMMLSQVSASISDPMEKLAATGKISDVLAEKFQEDESAMITTIVWLSDIDMQTVEKTATEVYMAGNCSPNLNRIQNIDEPQRIEQYFLSDNAIGYLVPNPADGIGETVYIRGTQKWWVFDRYQQNF